MPFYHYIIFNFLGLLTLGITIYCLGTRLVVTMKKSMIGLVKPLVNHALCCVILVRILILCWMRPRMQLHVEMQRAHSILPMKHSSYLYLKKVYLISTTDYVHVCSCHFLTWCNYLYWLLLFLPNVLWLLSFFRKCNIKDCSILRSFKRLVHVE